MKATNSTRMASLRTLAGTADKLLRHLEGLPESMHEPATAVGITLVGARLDNAHGDHFTDTDQNTGEYLLFIDHDGYKASYNLANLLALARIGAQALAGEAPLDVPNFYAEFERDRRNLARIFAQGSVDAR